MTLTCTSQTTGALTYAWFKDGTATGDTSSSLTITSFQTASHAGAYSCKVTLSGVESLMSVAAALSASSESLVTLQVARLRENYLFEALRVVWGGG